MYKQIDARFKTPLRMIISGPSGSGKSSFIRRLLTNASECLEGGRPEKIIWISGSPMTPDENLIESGKVDFFTRQIPSEDDLYRLAKQHDKGILVIFDDLIQLLKDSK